MSKYKRKLHLPTTLGQNKCHVVDIAARTGKKIEFAETEEGVTCAACNPGLLRIFKRSADKPLREPELNVVFEVRFFDGEWTHYAQLKEEILRIAEFVSRGGEPRLARLTHVERDRFVNALKELSILAELIKDIGLPGQKPYEP